MNSNDRSVAALCRTVQARDGAKVDGVRTELKYDRKGKCSPHSDHSKALMQMDPKVILYKRTGTLLHCGRWYGPGE